MKTSAFLLSALSFFVPLVLLPLAEAHGILGQVTIDGKTYQGPIAGGNSIPGFPIRQISDASPVKGAMNKAMTCGPNAKPASFVAPANPGSNVDVLWTANDRKNWPHNIGPMEAYLASCGSASCDKFDASNAQWFKINEVGQRNGAWVQQDQFNRKAHSFKLPSNLARGGYLLRHEIIALHLGDQPGGAEFYPGCIQINVGGNKSGAPSPKELVRFPGAYKDNDAGILFNAFDNAAYKFPGPGISKLASVTNGPSDDEDDTGSPSSPVPSSTKTKTPAQPTPTEGSDDDEDSEDDEDDADSPSSPVPSSTKTKTPAQPSPTVAPPKNGSGNCNPTKKRAVYDDSDDSIPSLPVPAPLTPVDDFKPRHISRVMARMVKPHSH